MFDKLTDRGGVLTVYRRAFRIYAGRVPLENGDYTMNHTAYVMLFDADGRFNQIFIYQEDPTQVVAKLALPWERDT